MRTWQAIAAGGLLLGMLLLPGVGASAVEPTPDDDGNLSVTIVDGATATPTPTPTRSGGQGTGSTGGGTGTGSGNGTGSGSGSGSGSGGGGNPGTPAGNTGGAAAPGEVSVAGMLYVGGLNSSVAISPNPGEGAVTLWFTVRNASKSTIDATADFWMNSQFFGNRVDGGSTAITALLPGESRVVTTQLHGAGQWAVLDAHVTLTPPASVDGTALTPVTRDATVLVFPWLGTTLLALLLIGFFVFRALRAALFVPAIATTA